MRSSAGDLAGEFARRPAGRSCRQRDAAATRSRDGLRYQPGVHRQQRHQTKGTSATVGTLSGRAFLFACWCSQKMQRLSF